MWWWWLTDIVLLCCFVLYPSAYGNKDPSKTPMNEWPMIQAHDAATTYLKPGLINRWAKTQQSGGISGMLECGARSFDWRPHLSKDGSLVMHHSFDIIQHSMSDAMDEVLKWSMERPLNKSADDFVVLGIFDCTSDEKGGDCLEAVSKLFAKKNITYIGDCSSVAWNKLTVSNAIEKFAMPPKGLGAPVMAINSCWNADYTCPECSCSGFGGGSLGGSGGGRSKEKTNRIEYTCYNNSTSKKFPLDRMFNYLQKTINGGPPKSGMFYSLQALWEETPESVIVSGLHGSSLLLDEVKSDFNHLLVERMKDGTLNVTKANFLEVNNVCHGGKELIETFREMASI